MATEGDRGREFVVLLEGEADVTKGGKRINTMKNGDFFGEIALVTKMPRTATVTATTDVRILVITERDFDALVKKSPEVGRGVAEALAERAARGTATRTGRGRRTAESRLRPKRRSAPTCNGRS